MKFSGVCSFCLMLIVVATATNYDYNDLYSAPAADPVVSFVSNPPAPNYGPPNNDIYAVPAANPVVNYVSNPPASNYGPPDNNPNKKEVALEFNTGSLLGPQVEVLALLEAFLKLKGAVASRVHALFVDNYDLIRSVINVIISKISTLHSFSLTGIAIIRKICEFAYNLIGNWHVALPSISLGIGQGAVVPAAPVAVAPAAPAYGVPAYDYQYFN